jgi:hypothetical protein
MDAGGRSGVGTKFRLFPKPPFLHPERPPELVRVSTPPGLIGPGPSDDRIYLIYPVGKHRSYGVNVGPYGTPHMYLPPWRGLIRPPVRPGPDGHFDHIPLDTPEFEEAHVYGTIRFVLDAWERYYGHRIPWHFARDFERLEVTIFPPLDNAHAGYGFMEIGAHHEKDGSLTPYALNFDVMAHELGHLIIYSTVGVPSGLNWPGEYFGFHESAADTVALIAVLYFETMMEDLLEDTHGNLYTYNELNRFAELSATTQIRLASNSVKMSQFVAGWRDEHILSEPLTGAIFDILVDIFQENLVERGIISREVADLTDKVEKSPEHAPVIQAVFDAAYPGHREAFGESLREARDYLGTALAETWKRLSADTLHYPAVRDTLLAIDQALSGGRYREEITESFDWREIGQVKIGPRLAKLDKSSHVLSPRTVVPEMGRWLPKMPYRERMLLAREM